MNVILVFSRPQEALDAAKAAREKLAELPEEEREGARLALRNALAEHFSSLSSASAAFATETTEEIAEDLCASLSFDVEVLPVPSGGLAESDLPEGFPARKRLRADGRFAMLAALKEASLEELGSVDGIGNKTVDEIDDALFEIEKEV